MTSAVQTLSNILLVGAGSCLGGIARYLTGKLFTPHTASATSMFPWATLTVNLAGCFLIGLIFGLLDRGITLSPSMKLFLTTGVCGGFTTFSTFTHENYLLFSGNHAAPLILYALLSVAGGFLMVYLAYWLTKTF